MMDLVLKDMRADTSINGLKFIEIFPVLRTEESELGACHNFLRNLVFSGPNHFGWRNSDLQIITLRSTSE